MIKCTPSAYATANKFFSLSSFSFGGFRLSSRRAAIILIALILFLSCAGCNGKLSRKTYIKWVRDYENNAHVRTTHAGFIFDLQFQPSEYILLQRGIENYTDSIRVGELKTLSATQYYTLTISREDKMDLISYGTNTLPEKEENQYYFSYRFQNDITLEEKGRILPCVLYHGEKPAVSGGGRTFVLGFENPEKNSTKAEIIIRSDMFGSSPVKIAISKLNIPPVDL